MLKLKYYPNSKKYFDEKKLVYISLVDIMEQVLIGEEIQVLESITKKDVTDKMLMKILIMRQKESPLPNTKALRFAIQFGLGNITTLINYSYNNHIECMERKV